MKNILIVMSSILMIALYSGCEEPERTELTKAERELLDSLYAEQVGFERKYSDSVCDATYQSIFNAARDSFYLEEVREIRAIMYGEG